MKATDAYRRINSSPIKGIVLYYTEQLKREIGSSKIKDVISQIQTGKTPPKAIPKYYSSDDINWFKPSDIGYGKYLVDAKEKFSTIALNEKKGTLYPANTLLIIGIGGGVGRVSILKESGSSNQQITGITFKDNINPEYAYYYFLVREDYIKSLAKSMSFPILNQENLKGLDFSYPEINEQNEFVRFVDECLNCFESGTEPDFSNFSVSDELKEYALKQFKIVNHFDTFSVENVTQSQLLSQLRQSILQEAIQGKLTENWRAENPNTENAETLLQRIKAEKEKTAKKGKKSSLPEITESEIPFELPENWVWCRLGEIGITQTGTTPSKNNSKFYGNHIPFIQPSNITEAGLNFDCIYLSESGLNDGRFIKKHSNLMVCIGGSAGKTCYNEIDVSCNQQINTITAYDDISHKYIDVVLKSPHFYSSVWSSIKQGSTPILNKGKWEQIIFPLPPLSEQHAIVEQVEKLLGKCTSLQTEMENLNTHSKTLLKALFAETFANG